jgi:hypothetical protein
LRPIEQSDVAAKERDELLPQAQTKCVLISPLKKKGTLLGEKQGEARQVDLPRIDLSLRKVGVDRKD